MASSLFASIFRRAPQVPANVHRFPFKLSQNPYRCKRSWPPDFSKLSEKHQFRLERRYRRRSKLKWARPRWTKAVKLVQWASVLFVGVYGVMFLEIDERETTVFKGIRAWAYKQMNELGGSPRVPKREEEAKPT